MSRFRFADFVFFAALQVSWLAVPVRGAETFDDITVTIEGRAQPRLSHGYMTRVIVLENTSPGRTHTVDLVQASHEGGNRSAHLGDLSRRVVLAPESLIRVLLPAPPLPVFSNNSLWVSIDGRRQRSPVQMPYSVSSRIGADLAGGSVPPLQFLVSRAINRDELHNAFTRHGLLKSQKPTVHTSSSSSGTVLLELLRAETPTAQWAPRWLAYTCYDGIFLTAADLATASPEAADALWRFAECGGALVVQGNCPIPETWAAMPLARVPNGLKAYRTGFGTCIICPATSLAALGKAQLRYIKAEARAFERTWSSIFDKRRAHEDFPVVEQVNIPIGGIFLIMVLFAIVAGPVNVLLLAKHDRRIWLFWTIPALSVFTTFTIICYMLFSEGITPTVRVGGVTILDERSQHATTLGLNGFYCPLTPRSGLHYSYDTEVTPRVFTSGVSSGSVRPRDVDWTADQHLYSGWVQPRVPAYFALRTSESRTERLHIRKEADGCLSILNGLGTDLSRLLIADAEGVVYECAEIPAGGRGTALQVENLGPSLPQGPDLAAICRQAKWQPSLFTKPRKYLGRSTYIAFLEGTPFVENGLRRRAKLTENSVVYGCYETAQ